MNLVCSLKFVHLIMTLAKLPFRGFEELKDSLLHLAFPHLCEGCGTDVVATDHFLCLQCLSSLPETAFHLHSANPIEKLFWGRLPLRYATAQYYFTKESMMQHLMHQFKYRKAKELGAYLGGLMGQSLASSNRFASIDALIPLPLFKGKERKRGYNQATVLCEGMATAMGKPVLKEAVVRLSHTESQTTKNRIERWQNMEGRFQVANPKALEGKHLLLVDDVVTTGATLEACGRAILEVSGVQLSVATLCFSSGN
ncbi:MAG: ComF family protein [Flaviaesturariibacter sp.]|nr:ComF family protein [Flaviaesturariibacter sp.]